MRKRGTTTERTAVRVILRVFAKELDRSPVLLIRKLIESYVTVSASICVRQSRARRYLAPARDHLVIILEGTLRVTLSGPPDRGVAIEREHENERAGAKVGIGRGEKRGGPIARAPEGREIGSRETRRRPSRDRRVRDRVTKRKREGYRQIIL